MNPEYPEIKKAEIVSLCGDPSDSGFIALGKVMKIFTSLVSAGFVALSFWSGVVYMRLVSAEAEISALKTSHTTVITVIERVNNLKEEMLTIKEDVASIREIVEGNDTRRRNANTIEREQYKQDHNWRNRIGDPLN